MKMRYMWELTSSMPLMSYVHEGTVKMEANRFLKNAVEKNKGEYAEIAKSFMK